MSRHLARFAVLLFLLVPLNTLMSSFVFDNGIQKTSLSNRLGDVEDTDDTPPSEDADEDNRFEVVAIPDFSLELSFIVSRVTGDRIEQLKVQHKLEVIIPPPKA